MYKRFLDENFSAYAFSYAEPKKNGQGSSSVFLLLRACGFNQIHSLAPSLTLDLVLIPGKGQEQQK